MKLRFTPRAVQNLSTIADYLKERSPQASRRVRGAILESPELLKLFPEAGQRQTTDNVRKLVTRKYAYLVYYMLDEPSAEIVILSISHPAQEREHGDL